MIEYNFITSVDMSAIARKQDLPPEGGYKTLNYSRIPAKSLIGGKGLILANLAITTGALYLYSLNYRKIRHETIELRSSMLAVTPMLTAERDRAYLKELRRNRDEEAKLMSGVEGWEVGKFYGEPVFKTLPPDTLVKPEFFEYYAHSSRKDAKKNCDILLWQ